MKVKQLLKMYANSRRDFQGENLRGLSFKNQDLSGADFSDCDIRGTDFSGANLTEARFIHTKAGLTRRWFIILLLTTLLLTLTAVFFALCFGVITALTFDSKQPNNQMAAWFGLFAMIIFSCLSFSQEVRVIVSVMVAIAIGIFVGTQTFAVVINVVLAGVVVVLVTSTATFAGTLAFIGILPVFLVSLVVGIVGSVGFGVLVESVNLAFAGVEAKGLALIGAILIAFLNCYLGWRAMKGNPRDEWIRLIALKFPSIGATTFNKANLTDADFTGAILKNANFQGAILIRTCFKDTRTYALK